VSTLRVGTGRAIITPPLGIQLAGYGHRTKGADEVLDELEVRAFWLEQEGADGAGSGPACIITADIIGFDALLTQRLRTLLTQRLKVAPEAVMLAASHTHSGPQTCENVVGAGGPPDPYYMNRLVERILQAAGEAQNAAAPVTVHVGKSTLEGYAVNRRLRVDGQVRMAPNRAGIRDDDVTVVLFRDAATGTPRGLLFHYTCHPTIMGSYAITSEYPGAARRYVERALGGAACGFLPGCFGDIRPDCTLIGGKVFRRGTYQDVQAFGDALGAEVLRAAEQAVALDTPPRLVAAARDVNLPLAAKPRTASLSLQRLDISPGLRFVALGGEVCVEYGHFIKGLDPDAVTIPVGYANGMVAYIPTAAMILEGGYEAEGSCRYFGLPSPFKPELEERIKEAVRALF